MLHLAKLIAKYRSLISIVLFAPFLTLVFSSQFRVGMVPENPYMQFDVYFSVPSRTAKEIEKKVTIPSEKVFNGLSHLIGIQSKTDSEHAVISLRFSEQAKASVIYLNIQEKMDRIKLMLPGDVDSYEVRKVESKRPADIVFNFLESVPQGEIAEILAPFQSVISKTDPSLWSQSGVRVHIDPIKLAENKLSISQVVVAMRSLGMTTSLGRSDGVMFETGRSFNSIDDIKSALVAARGHRPILLRDVAEIEVVHLSSLKSIRIWTDPERADNGAIVSAVTEYISTVEVGRPLWKAILSQTIQPVLLIFLCFFLNFYVIKVLKLPASSLLFLAIMGGLVCVHFLFWKGLFGSITVLDLHALAFTLIIGSMFLSVLYLRIRSFFSEETMLDRSAKNLDQAKLFALAELAPTFFVLVLGMWIMALPVLTTAINLPSRAIFSSMFYYGFPVLFFIIIFMLLSTPGAFLSQKVSTPKSKLNWKLSGKYESYGVATVLIFTIFTFFIFARFDFGIHKSEDVDSFSMSMVDNYRGYGQQLIFREVGVAKKVSSVATSKVESLVLRPTQVYTFSPAGMRYLSDLDLLGFADSLKSLQGELVFGEMNSSGNSLAVSFSPSKFLNDDLPNLIFASKESNLLSKSVRTIMDSHITVVEESIVRDNMSRGDRLVFDNGDSLGSFSRKLPDGIEPTPWAGFLIDQFKRYKSYHLVSLTFLFLMFAIYLNSFVRSGLVVLFAVATAGFELLIHTLLPGIFHADSLWLGNVGTYMAMFQILVLARLIDIERSRGFDRDLCVSDIKNKMAPGVYLCSWSFVLALFVAGATEYIPGLPTLGFWKEAIPMSIISGIILIFSAHILFPLYYLKSETTVNHMAFKLYRWNPFRKG